MTVADFIKRVKVLLDENQQSAQLINAGSSNGVQLDIEALIKESLSGGIRYVVTNAPTEMLGGGVKYTLPSPSTGMLSTYLETGTKYYVQPIDNTVLRVVSAKLSNWAFGVNNSDITTDHPLYREQFSRYMGIRATRTNPLVVMAPCASGRSVQMFPAEDSSHIEYIRVVMDVDSSTITETTDLGSLVDPMLHSSLMYAVASLVCTSLQDERASNFMTIANEMMGANKQRRL